MPTFSHACTLITLFFSIHHLLSSYLYRHLSFFFLIPLNPFPLITLSTYSAFAHHKLPHLLSLIHMTCRHDLFDACMTSLDPLISQVFKCVRVMNWKRFSEIMRLKFLKAASLSPLSWGRPKPPCLMGLINSSLFFPLYEGYPRWF